MSLVVLTALWTVRALRTRKQRKPPAAVTYSSFGKHHCSLSPSAVRLLVRIAITRRSNSVLHAPDAEFIAVGVNRPHPAPIDRHQIP